MKFFDSLKEKLKTEKMSIVFPEGSEKRIIEACVRLKKEDLLEPILIGEKDEIEKTAKENGFDISSLTIVSQSNYPEKEELIKTFFERRKGKVTEEEAKTQVETDPNLFGVLLVYTGKADGMVSGAVHSTADTVRPALQVIKTKEGYKSVSGLMILEKGDELYMFADCAITINPTSEGLAEIAVQTNETAKKYGIDPRIAMLSFSTNGSAKSEESTKVVEAMKILREKHPELPVDGEMQFDAAVAKEVGALKFPGSKVAGQANCFVFPTLDAGNIGYKIAQRLGGFDAVGPILQGMNAPVNDLSRGCVPEDVYYLAITTAVQAMGDE